MTRCEGVESDCMWAYKIHEKTNKEDFFSFFFEEEIDRKVHSYVDITYECTKTNQVDRIENRHNRQADKTYFFTVIMQNCSAKLLSSFSSPFTQLDGSFVN